MPDAKKTNNIPAVKASVPIITKAPATAEDTKPIVQKDRGETAADGTTEDSDIVVMTNQLLSVLSVPLSTKDTNVMSKKNKETDSTLAAMSDIGDIKDPLQYRIEFWKSPLNYKGYKMSRGKIILYGMSPVNPGNLA